MRVFGNKAASFLAGLRILLAALLALASVGASGANWFVRPSGGTLSDGTAAAFSTAGLPKGVHSLTAQVTLSDGTVLPFVTGWFTIPQ